MLEIFSRLGLSPYYLNYLLGEKQSPRGFLSYSVFVGFLSYGILLLVRKMENLEIYFVSAVGIFSIIFMLNASGILKILAPFFLLAIHRFLLLFYTRVGPHECIVAFLILPSSLSLIYSAYQWGVF